MAGNYDVTNVTVRNGIDNSTSFKTVNGKKQFIGTPWNETSHITNDANKGTIFEADKGMTLKLNSRYKNGGADVYSNLDGKHTGISFDLLDKFIEAAADGKLEDVDHQGYTRENMVAFGKAFDELRAQKLAEAKKDPYKKEYTKMMNGTEFTFTAEELKTLYKAAGFDLVQKKEDKQQEIAVDDVPPSAKEQKIKDVPPTQENQRPQKAHGVEDNDEGNEKISQHGKQNANLIITELGLPEDACIEFKGEVLRDGDKIIYAEGSYTLENGETKKFRIDNSGDEKVVQTKKKGLFRKWHNVNENAEAAEAKAPARAAAKRQAPAPQKSEAELEQEELAKYYDEHVTNAKYWSSRVSVDKNTNKEDDFQGSYDQVTAKDGRKLARVSSYSNGKTEYKYYEVKATKIHNQYNQVYSQIIPDLEKEVTDFE